ncbi:hypothetical protein [Polyangium jinanense]|uniref:Uncharacterized protein n=1 Tax=Polyangium jinanense TaxID=2829994 RepID=A0A9X3X803_9BACT|nr:hypothetical protein [Polyangium jinanense]MDC3983141.1 hypothetical protein [Polyangium jinanense]
MKRILGKSSAARIVSGCDVNEPPDPGLLMFGRGMSRAKHVKAADRLDPRRSATERRAPDLARGPPPERAEP